METRKYRYVKISLLGDRDRQGEYQELIEKIIDDKYREESATGNKHWLLNFGFGGMNSGGLIYMSNSETQFNPIEWFELIKDYVKSGEIICFNNDYWNEGCRLLVDDKGYRMQELKFMDLGYWGD